ncbi:MAG: YbhB/YbcL family Raf kinase inhibitor-like protein [Actinobacteria bacterium]|nr:YbhB/YbcL family Raf kinase inhibitor-like protein [Actinomycetota bacterium]
MRVTSPSFEYGRRIPARHTCDGDGVPPRLDVDGIPAGAISLAVLVEDPDAPGGTWVHWVRFDLPPESPVAAEGGRTGANSWRRAAYDGPCPPTGTHRYLYRVYALSDTLRLPDRSTAAEVRAAMEGTVLDEAVLMGRYGR